MLGSSVNGFFVLIIEATEVMCSVQEAAGDGLTPEIGNNGHQVYDYSSSQQDPVLGGAPSRARNTKMCDSSTNILRTSVETDN